MQQYTKEQTIKLVNDFIKNHKLDITIQEIENIIYDSDDHNFVFQMWLNHCEKAGLELEQVNIDLIVNCWNNFPHKALGGKSPIEFRNLQ